MDSKRIRKNRIIWKNYDFVVDCEKNLFVKTIYDIHRYLMIKHNIIIP